MQKTTMRPFSSALLGVMTMCAATAADPVRLSAGGKTRYRIVIADKPQLSVKAGAQELAHFLEEITGAVFPVVQASAAEGEHQILVGASSALEKLSLDVDWESLGPEGFVLRTVGKRLVIVGGPRRGAINGVYTFLEDVAGCRWYTPSISVIPRVPDLTVGPLAVRVVPVFESRSQRHASAADAAWAARQRLNNFTRDVTSFTRRSDGSQVDWDEFINDPRLADAWIYAEWHVHTLGHNQLLRYSQFAEHPEYFALRGGKRMEKGQPCLTNPDLVQYIGRRAGEWLKAEPMARIISVSHGDFANECQCDNCRAAYKTQGGTTGVYMRFVNRVAAEIEKDFPDVIVDTLAYSMTRTPLEGVSMRRNVVVRYAPLWACYHHAFDECGYNVSKNYHEELQAWSKITPRLWVWYYALPRSMLHPYPNLNCLSRNFKLMRDAGVRGIFIENQKGPIEIGGLNELAGYLFAKLMWNPDYDVEKGTADFIDACYGAAAPQIARYVELVNEADTYIGTIPVHNYRHAAVCRAMARFPGLHIACVGTLGLREQKLREMDRLFDQAERAVAGESQLLDRVRLVRLSLQYAIILYCEEDDPIRRRAMRDFFARAEQASMSTIWNPKSDQVDRLTTFRKDAESSFRKPQKDKKRYACGRFTQTPVLDGKVAGDPGWKNAAQATGFTALGNDTPIPKQTSFAMGYTSEALYVAVTCEEPQMGRLKAELKDAEDVWLDDSVELFLQPKGTDDCYQFAVNAIGSQASRLPFDPLERTSRRWQAQAHRGPDHWSVEIRIPWELFLTVPEKGAEWTGNVCRNIFTSGQPYWSWADLQAGFAEPQNFARIVFGDEISPEARKKIEDRIKP